MVSAALSVICLMTSSYLWAAGDQHPSYPSFDYDTARAHEIKPHRDTVQVQGVRSGLNQLHITLIVSPAGDVIEADEMGNPEMSKFWPQLQGEVLQWKFVPFEQGGKPVTAEVEEYIDLVPPQRLPKVHLTAPEVRPDSNVRVTLQRTGCMGSCPAYTVTVATDGIVFDGGGSVVASGKHTDIVDADSVRKLAKDFVAADFYSMDARYSASATDLPTYVLSISIDGRNTSVMDYEGRWEGMPEVVTDLEDEVDTFARTERWIAGDDGLVPALHAEKFDFQTFEAQTILKAAATRGQTVTVRELLEAGVLLKPLAAAKPKEDYVGVPFQHVGWLNAASSHPQTLKALIDAAASKNDQNDKNLVLVGAADSGKL
jgi:hypothetical protein